METTECRSGRTHAAVIERRSVGRSHDVPPETILADTIWAAEHQLADAREHLRAARRRVVQLEEVVEGWRDIAGRLERPRA